MIQLHILNGSMAGTRWVACRLPFTVGRSPEDDLRMQDAGIWSGHCRVELRDDSRFVLVAATEAPTSVNGGPAREALIRNGDILEIGSVRVQFGLSPTRHRSLRFREAMTWCALAVLALVQIALIYALSVEL